MLINNGLQYKQLQHMSNSSGKRRYSGTGPGFGVRMWDGGVWNLDGEGLGTFQVYKMYRAETWEVYGITAFTSKIKCFDRFRGGGGGCAHPRPLNPHLADTIISWYPSIVHQWFTFLTIVCSSHLWMSYKTIPYLVVIR